MFKCETCIHKNKIEIRKEICVGLCKDVFTRLNRENQCYQEIIKKPSCCGECTFLKESPCGGLMCTVNTWDSDDRRILFNAVRKNYLKKNTPIWCQLE